MSLGFLLEIIVEGYAKTCLNDDKIPKVILSEVVLFVGNANIIPCKAFTQTFCLFNDNWSNIINIYVNRRNLVFLTNKMKAFIAKSDKAVDKQLINVDNIQCISNGLANRHLFVYTNDNKLYGCGANNHGQLGIKNYNNESYHGNLTPQMVTFDFGSKLIQIQCGQEHTLFLTKNGSAYGCGYNSVGQLSIKAENTSHGDIIKFDVNNVIQIGSTDYTSFLLDKEYNLYSFGSNYGGKMGINNMPNDNESRTIYKITKNRFIKPKYICCGEFHVCCITLDNNVMSFGKNYYGQCGVYNTKSTIIKPKILNMTTPHNIIDIKCGNTHTIIVTKKFDYYAFGNNDRKQLLLENENESTIYSPTLISKKYISKMIGYDVIIVDIILGFNETFILVR